METQTITVTTPGVYFLPLLWQGQGDTLHYDIELAVPEASVQMTGLLLGKAESTLHITVNVTHSAPHTTSAVLINGVIKDTAGITFDGLVTINNGAKQSKARLDSHILLLSDNAKGRVVPSLEIKENDVKAGHAATVGKVDPIQLFYLQSRGLSPQMAKRVLVAGFLRSTIDKLPKNLQKEAEQGILEYVE